MKVRVINDRTGWTDVVDLPDDSLAYRILITNEMPFIDDVHGGCGHYLYTASGERDAQGLLIFRTREQ